MTARYHTPLRYPGGKQKLTPFIIEVLEANDMVGGEYAEPYAGGAGVAVELLLRKHVRKIHLNDSALPIYAFWHSVLKETDALNAMISSASMTIEEWKRRRDIVRTPEQHTLLELGYSAFFLNRCNRSGVLSGGVIGGLGQLGNWKMDARFTRNELIRRIENIANRRSSIVVKNWDAERFMTNHVGCLPQDTLVYCDPPYFEKASRLYLNSYSTDDHERIAKYIQGKLNHKWMVSYDSAPEIITYYKKRRSFLYDLQYNASRVYQGREIFIFSDDLKIPKASGLPYIAHALFENKGRLRARRSMDTAA
ncbi:DNA adenine methylase [Xanthomonas arboricola]|uniref:DNA adenine methylase n=1 Tax=Xanthomonas arboricola TaxID=56448 RepID=UPI00161C9A9C|nr:DNA adenine methylase [Xanthomonas arboricola]MBB4598920.1 DNA adenine methylase [Xanthomonas arboricola]